VTHGKRAIHLQGPRNRGRDREIRKYHPLLRGRTQDSQRENTPFGGVRGAPSTGLNSVDATPGLTPGTSAPPSRAPSISFSDARRPSFGSRLFNILTLAAGVRLREEEESLLQEQAIAEDDEFIQPMQIDTDKETPEDVLEAWHVEASGVDRGVRMLPGVRKMLDSIPHGRYAVATSGAKTYGTF